MHFNYNRPHIFPLGDVTGAAFVFMQIARHILLLSVDLTNISSPCISVLLGRYLRYAQ